MSRKAVRLIAYGGRSRVDAARETSFPGGYAANFEELVVHLNRLIPSNEVIGVALRRDVPMYPPAAVRELVANALIHQDFAIAGAGPVVELFSDRLEVTNPGNPLVEPLRFVDFPPRSRNEAVASLMRRAGICEERGSEWDKIATAVEAFQLPAPRIDILGESLRVALFAHQSLTTMDRENRIRAVYLHSVLRFVTNEVTTNTSVRQRFSISEGSAAQASRLLREALDEGMIKKQSDAASRRHTTYVPFWA